MTLQVVADFMPNWRNRLDDSTNAGAYICLCCRKTPAFGAAIPIPHLKRTQLVQHIERLHSFDAEFSKPSLSLRYER